MTLPAYAMNRASFPEMYERTLVGPLFRPFVEAVLEHVPLAAGQRLLDIACGTGIVARLAKERLGSGGRVVAVDLSPQMLAVAKGLAPDIEWREGDATALPVGSGETFDVVICHQGMQFFADRPAAAREMRRVLAPGGRVAVATWLGADENPFFHELDRIAERHVGAFVDQRHALGAASDLEALLTGAGFRDVRVQTITRTVRFSDPGVFLQMNAMAMVGMSPAGKEMPEEERARLAGVIAEESASVLPRYSDGAPLAFALGTNLGTGRV